MPHDKPITYTDDTGLIYYRASAFGSCPRALYASRRGYSPEPNPPNVLKAFEDGHNSEDHIRSLVEQQGWLTYDHQREVSFRCGPVVIVGHIDWMIKDPIHDQGPYVCDAKALSPENFKLWRTYGFDRFPKYAWQLSVYARAKKAPICMAVFNKETEELDLTYIDTPPHTFSDMLERVLEVERYVSSEDATLPTCQPDNFFCPYGYLHDNLFDDVSLSGGMEQLKQNRLWSLASEYASAKRAESTAKNKAAEILKQIDIESTDALKDKTKIRVLKTGAKVPYNINRVTQTKRVINKESLGQYLQSTSHSLTEFEEPQTSSYLRVTAVTKKDREEDATTTTESQ